MSQRSGAKGEPQRASPQPWGCFRRCCRTLSHKLRRCDFGLMLLSVVVLRIHMSENAKPIWPSLRGVVAASRAVRTLGRNASIGRCGWPIVAFWEALRVRLQPRLSQADDRLSALLFSLRRPARITWSEAAISPRSNGDAEISAEEHHEKKRQTDGGGWRAFPMPPFGMRSR
jgi:hypothetical protein